jgi:hypothetical protein
MSFIQKKKLKKKKKKKAKRVKANFKMGKMDKWELNDISNQPAKNYDRH